jgi:RimJ/RimL family protein N-acetyltransferase
MSYEFELREIAEEKIEAYSPLFASWRNRHLKYFLDQREVTQESNEAFLRSKLENPTSHFFVALFGGQPVGHVGLKNIGESEGELDNLLVGVRVKDLNLAQEMERRMLNLCFDTFGLSRVYLHLLSHNILVKRLHEHFGFTKCRDYLLHSNTPNGGAFYKLCEDGNCKSDHSEIRAEMWELKK